MPLSKRHRTVQRSVKLSFSPLRSMYSVLLGSPNAISAVLLTLPATTHLPTTHRRDVLESGHIHAEGNHDMPTPRTRTDHVHEVHDGGDRHWLAFQWLKHLQQPDRESICVTLQRVPLLTRQANQVARTPCILSCSSFRISPPWLTPPKPLIGSPAPCPNHQCNHQLPDSLQETGSPPLPFARRSNPHQPCGSWSSRTRAAASEGSRRRSGTVLTPPSPGKTARSTFRIAAAQLMWVTFRQPTSLESGMTKTWCFLVLGPHTVTRPAP